MSLLFYDGCGEYYATADVGTVWDIVAGTPVVANSGRNGGNAIVLASVNDRIEAAIAPSSTIFVGFGMRKETLGQHTILDILSSGAQQLRIELTAAGAITVDRGTSTFLGATADGKITPENFHYIQIQMVIADGTDGSVRIRIDGLEELNLPFVNTNGAGGSNFNVTGIEFNGHNEVDGTRFDDVWICNDEGDAPHNTFLGSVRIQAALPDADGANTEFATTFPASPTDHFSKIDDSTPNTTDYNQSSAANQRDLCEYAALPEFVGAVVLAVKALGFGAMQASGNGTARFITRPTGSIFNGSTKGYSEGFTYQNQVWLTNPQTGLAWTEDEINAAQFGVEKL